MIIILYENYCVRACACVEMCTIVINAIVMMVMNGMEHDDGGGGVSNRNSSISKALSLSLLS